MGRHTPDYRWQIDWDDDGLYQHPYSDVTDVYESHSILFGSNPSLRGNDVRTQTATGSLVLVDAQGRYDPDDSRLRVAETKLRQRHAVRLLADGAVAWQGVCEPSNSPDRSGIVRLAWRLQGKRSGILTLGERELNIGSGTVAGLAQTWTAETGIPLSVASAQPHGLVFFKGNWLYFLGAFGRYAGGWCVEDHNGNWIFRSFADTPTLPVSATLDLGYGPDDDVDRAERAGHVRNYARCRAFAWVDQTDTSAVAFASHQMGEAEQRVFTLVHENTAIRRSRSMDTFTVSATAFTQTPVIVSVEQQTATVSKVRVQTGGLLNSGDGTGRVTVSADGTISTREEVSSRQLRVTEFATQDVFGERELRVPPWFPTDFDGIFTWTLPWLRNLSQPPSHIAITYSEQQDSESRFAILRDACVPGRAVNFEYVKNGAVRSFEGLVLAVRHSGRRNHPGERTVFAVERRSEPPAPLGVTFDYVGDVTAQAVVSVEDPQGETVYSRRRTA